MYHDQSSHSRAGVRCRHIAIIGLLSLCLSACGGGSEGSNNSVYAQPVVVPTYAVDAAVCTLVHGYTAVGTVEGGIAGLPVVGTATTRLVSDHLITSQFQSNFAIEARRREDLAFIIAGVTQRTLSAATREYYVVGFKPLSLGYAFLGAIDDTTGRYSVVSNGPGLPKAAKVGDVGSLGQVTIYSDASKSKIVATQELSYAIEADTSTSAILRLTTISTDVDWDIPNMQDDRFRISPDGLVRPLTSQRIYSLAGTGDVLGITYTSISGPANSSNTATPTNVEYLASDQCQGQYIVRP